MQDFPDEFVAPCSVHEINHLRLTLHPNVALEADEDGPVIYGNGVSYRFADIEEWDALAECVSVSDDRSLGRRPHVDLDASRTVGQDVSVSGSGRMSK